MRPLAVGKEAGSVVLVFLTFQEYTRGLLAASWGLHHNHTGDHASVSSFPPPRNPNLAGTPFFSQVILT